MSDQLEKLDRLIAQASSNAAFLHILHAQERLSLARAAVDQRHDGIPAADIELELRNLESTYRDLCNLHGFTCHLPPLRDSFRELSHKVALTPPGQWLEDELSKCEFGCKIYRNTMTGARVLAHNSAYGCFK